MKRQAKPVSVHEAKTHLSRLLQRTQRGEQIIIARSGKPIAKLVALFPEPQKRQLGRDAGKIWIAEDFDAPLDPESFS